MPSRVFAAPARMERRSGSSIASGIGRLRNGNPPGDLRLAPRCGARTRAGHDCRQPAMKNGRCRLHGGKSTRPRTPEGLARSRRARWVHGARSREFAALRAEGVRIRRRIRALCDQLQAAAARDAASPVGMGFIVANPKGAPSTGRWLAVGRSPGFPVTPEVLLDRGGPECHSFGHNRASRGGPP